MTAKERVVELEKQIAEYKSGKYLFLPCKVNDNIFIPYLRDTMSGIFEGRVYLICTDIYGIWEVHAEIDTDNNIELENQYSHQLLSNYGITWFTDKGKAEEKLKEWEKLRDEND